MTDYFPHDYNARNDPKLTKLRKDMGLEGIGLFWVIVETIYEQGGYILPADVESIAYDMHLKDSKKVYQVLNDFNLFQRKGEKIFSESAKKRLKHRSEVSKKRSDAAKKMHESKAVSSDANAEQMQSKCYALKESKVNKSKAVEVKEEERVVDVKKVKPKAQSQGQTPLTLINPERQVNDTTDFAGRKGVLDGMENKRKMNNIISGIIKEVPRG